MHPLGISDDQFWALDVFANAKDPLAESRAAVQPGLAIDAPSSADLAARKWLPLAVVYTVTNAEANYLRVPEDAALVALRLEDGEARVAQLVEAFQGKPPHKPTAPAPRERVRNPEAPPGIVGGRFLQDVTALLHPGPGTWVFRLLLGDRIAACGPSRISGIAETQKPRTPPVAKPAADAPPPPATPGLKLVSKGSRFAGSVRGKGAAALVLVVLLSEDDPGPRVFPLSVALHDGVGTFAVEGPAPGYVGWAFSEEEIAGPAR